MMNPKLLALTLASFLTCTALAQINFGIRTGANFNNVHTSEGLSAVTPDFKNITTWNVAAVTEFELNDRFSIQPELVYNTKGFSIKETGDIELFDVPLPVGLYAVSKFNYLELPVLAKVKFGNERVNAYLQAGPSLGYAIDGRLITRAKVFFEFDVFDTDIDLDDVGYERWEASGIIGGGVEFALRRGKIMLDARYQHGFTELYDIPVFNEQIKNRGVNISAGYLAYF